MGHGRPLKKSETIVREEVNCQALSFKGIRWSLALSRVTNDGYCKFGRKQSTREIAKQSSDRHLLENDGTGTMVSRLSKVEDQVVFRFGFDSPRYDQTCFATRVLVTRHAFPHNGNSLPKTSYNIGLTTFGCCTPLLSLFLCGVCRGIFH